MTDNAPWASQPLQWADLLKPDFKSILDLQRERYEAEQRAIADDDGMQDLMVEAREKGWYREDLGFRVDDLIDYLAAHHHELLQAKMGEEEGG